MSKLQSKKILSSLENLNTSILSKNALKSNKNPNAKEQVLEGLINGANDITALNSGKYGNTRISNPICDLRKLGLIIHTIRTRTLNGKWYGIYRLDKAEPNRAKAFVILEQMRKARKSS